MGRLLAWLCVVACLSGSCSRRGPRATRLHREGCAGASGSRCRSCRRLSDGDLELRSSGRRHESPSQLANRYTEYKSDPANFGEIVDAHRRVIERRGDGDPAKPDRMRIVPVIKDRDWLDEIGTARRRAEGARRFCSRSSTRSSWSSTRGQREPDALSDVKRGHRRRAQGAAQARSRESGAHPAEDRDAQGTIFRDDRRPAAITRQACCFSTTSGMAGRSRWRAISSWRCRPRMRCWSPARRTAKVSRPYARWLRSS